MVITSTNAISKAFLPGYYLVEESTPTSASNFEWFLSSFWSRTAWR